MANNSKPDEEKPLRPAQEQHRQPGRESEMDPRPLYEGPFPQGKRLEGHVALITGGDSGIGRAVAVAFAREGADVGIIYLEEDEDASETRRVVERHGGKCLLHRCDIRSKSACADAVAKVIKTFGKLDLLINNAAEQYPQDSITDISEEQL